MNRRSGRRAYSSRREPGSCGGRGRRRDRAGCARRSARRRHHRWPAPAACARRPTPPSGRRTAPRPVGDRRAQLRRLPSVLVDLDLDGVDPAVRRPGDPGNRHGSGRDAVPVARGVDPRLRQDRRFLRPAQRDPVRVERLERRQLDLGQPLRGAHVAVEARHDEPGREPMFGGQRLPVHRHRHQALPLVGERPHRREADREAVDRASHDLGRGGIHAGLLQQLLQPDPAHSALPTRSPPTSLLTQAMVTYCSWSGRAKEKDGEEESVGSEVDLSVIILIPTMFYVYRIKGLLRTVSKIIIDRS